MTQPHLNVDGELLHRVQDVGTDVIAGSQPSVLVKVKSLEVVQPEVPETTRNASDIEKERRRWLFVAAVKGKKRANKPIRNSK